MTEVSRFSRLPSSGRVLAKSKHNKYTAVIHTVQT